MQALSLRSVKPGKLIFPSPVFNLLIKQIKKAVLQPPNLLGPIILQFGYSQSYIWNYIRQFGKKCWFLDPRSRDRGWLLRKGPLVIPQAITDLEGFEINTLVSHPELLPI